VPANCAIEEGIVQLELSPSQPINGKQLRRLHALWHRWAGGFALSREADRQLRHHCVELFTEGRAHETLELSGCDAALVIEQLAKLTHQAETRLNQIAGTAGREGYPERRRIAPNATAWSALWRCASELGMERATLESFVQRHYGRFGLHGLDDIRSMADLNRVLWGLKAMLRRRGAKNPSQLATKRAA
jgi:hypothetical protein